MILVNPILVAFIVILLSLLIYVLFHWGSWILFARIKSFGLQVKKVRFLCFENISFIPPLHIRAATKVECVEVKKIAIRPRWPTFDLPSIWSVNISSVYVQADMSISDSSLFPAPNESNPKPQTTNPKKNSGEESSNFVFKAKKYLKHIFSNILLRVISCSAGLVLDNIVFNVVTEDGDEILYKQDSLRVHISNEKFDITKMLTRMYIKIQMTNLKISHIKSSAEGDISEIPIITHSDSFYISIGLSIMALLTDFQNTSANISFKKIIINEVLLRQLISKLKLKKERKNIDLNISKVPIVQDNLKNDWENLKNEDNEETFKSKLERIKDKIISILSKEIQVDISFTEISYLHESGFALKDLLVEWKICNFRISVVGKKKWMSSSYVLDSSFEISDIYLNVISSVVNKNVSIGHRKGATFTFFMLLNEGLGDNKIFSSFDFPSSSSIVSESELWLYVAFFSSLYLRDFTEKLIKRMKPTKLEKYVKSSTKPKLQIDLLCDYIVNNFVVDIDWVVHPLTTGFKLYTGEIFKFSFPAVRLSAKSHIQGLLSRNDVEYLSVKFSIKDISVFLDTEIKKDHGIFNLPMIKVSATFNKDGDYKLSIEQQKFKGYLWNFKVTDNFMKCIQNDDIYSKAFALLDVNKLVTYYNDTVAGFNNLAKNASNVNSSAKRISSSKLNSAIPCKPLFKTVNINLEGGEFFISGIDNRCSSGISISEIKGSGIDYVSKKMEPTVLTDVSEIIPPLNINIKSLSIITRRVYEEDEHICQSKNIISSPLVDIQNIDITIIGNSVKGNVVLIGGIIDLTNAWVALKVYQLIYKRYVQVRSAYGELYRLRNLVSAGTRAPDVPLHKIQEISSNIHIFFKIQDIGLTFKSTDAIANIEISNGEIENLTAKVESGKILVSYGPYQREKIFYIENFLFKRTVSCSLFNLHIPYGFYFYNFLDSIIHFIKMFKAVLPPKTYPRFHLPPKWPLISLHIEKFVFDADDHNIEVLLTFLAQNGKMEQYERVQRTTLFEEKVLDLKKQGKKTLGVETIRAYEYLQQHNSESWIKICKDSRPKQSKLLMELILWGLKLELNTATLSQPTCEASLHELDPDTPLGIIYMDMFPFNARLESTGAVLRLRDYPIPIFEIPRRDKPVLVSSGLLILAEEAPNEAAKRHIKLDVKYFNEICTITRSVFPMKFYCDLKHNISCNGTVRLGFGSSLEPALQEFVSVIDQFTKPNVDPSPPIGWWDKLRLISHGRHVLHLTGGSKFAIRMTGSMSPYFQPGYEFGSEGFELIFGDNVTIDIGGSEKTISIDSGYMFGSLASGLVNDYFFKFAGGVVLNIGIDFHVEGKRRSHSAIRLRTPQYCNVENGVWDSFANFRTSKILLDFSVISRKSLYSGLVEPSNFLCLGPIVLDHFDRMFSVMQSPLTNISREGAIWNKQSSGKPKLGRTMGGLRANVKLSPFVIAYQTSEYSNYAGVELRFKTEYFDLDLMLKQQILSEIRKEKTDKKEKTSKYSLTYASMRVDELEGRVVYYGNTDWDSENNTGDPFALSMDDLEDQVEWLLPSDNALAEEDIKWRMVPFFWTPQITYFLRNDDARNSTSKDVLHDVFYSSQIHIYRARLREIHSVIAKYESQFKALEAQLLKNDSSLLKIHRTKVLEKLDILKSRRTMVEEFLHRCGNSRADSCINETYTGSNKRAVFRHNFVLHNGHMLWKRSVKNTFLRLFELKSKHAAIHRILTNTVTQVLKEYHQLLSKGDRTAEALAGIFGTNQNTNQNPTDGSFNSQTEIAKANRLLHKLVAERTSKFYVYNENYDENGNKLLIKEASGNINTNDSDNKEALYGEKAYIPSNDDSSPDYISDYQTFASNFLIQCIHPQVNFEVENPRDKRIVESVIVGAEIMEIKHIRIFDTQSVTTLSPEGQKVIDIGDEEPIKTRLIVDVNNSQFHTAVNTEVKNTNSELIYSNVINTGASLWPVWIPMEFLIDKIYPDPNGYLNLVVEKASATMHKENPNSLYYNAKRTRAEDMESKYLISFHNFDVSSTSAQYIAIYNVITKMILISNPAKVKEEEKIQKIYFALEQLDNIDLVFSRALHLQQKLRFIYQKFLANKAYIKFTSSGFENKEKKLIDRNMAKALIICQEEIACTIAALNLLKASHEKSTKIEDMGEFRIFVDKLMWNMMVDKNDSICVWKFENIDFINKHTADKSSSKTLTIDNLTIDNRSPTCPFTGLVRPFIPNKILYNLFQKQHILRVYWRDLPPVAGIEVVDHFEIDLFPLLLYLTYDSVKNIVSYIFPDDDAELPPVNSEDLALLYSYGNEYLTQKQSLLKCKAYWEDTKEKTIEGGKKKDEKQKIKDVIPSNENENSQYSDLKKMQVRASENKSYIYIKIPGTEHCLNYRGPKDKNIEDITMFVFKMQTLEFRNKTWTMLDLLNAIKKEVMRSLLANTGALVREKLFAKKRVEIMDSEFV